MLAGPDRGARMANADRWIAGGLHDDFDIAGRGLGAIGSEGGRGDPGIVPPDSAAGLARAVRIEIDDHRHLEPRCGRPLRQEHRAELAALAEKVAEKV